MTNTWSFCLIFIIYAVPCSAEITVNDGQNVWAVNITGLEFAYSLDCSNPATACAYSWKHDGISILVERFGGGAACDTSNPAYAATCSYPSSTLISTFTIFKRLSVNNTEVVVEGSAVTGVTPFVIRLEYCDINDLENPNAVSLSPDLCDFNCVSTFSCIEGFAETSAALTCLRNASWSSTNLICEPVSCSGSSCNNCCKVNSQSQLSNIGVLSYNESVTAKCCEGFSDSNVGTASFTCNKSGSINPNLNCMPVSCSGSSCNNCCEVNSRSQLSNIDALSYNKSVTAECCEGFSDPNVERASFTCNESGSIDLNLNCMPVMCSLDQCDKCCYSGPAVPAGNTLSYNQSVTVECCDGFNETNGTTSMNYTCLSNQSIAVNLTCVKGGSLGLRTGSVGVAFVLYVTSLGLCFGLNGETCEFITGGIVGLVIGIIAITDIIVCCVWTLIRKIQSESKVPGSTTSNDRGKPGDNSVTREEDVNMMPGSGNH